jgi:SAM-dependent methyltransferase
MAVKTVLTGFRSIPYRSGYVYNWTTKRLYDQHKKFMSIAKIIGNDSKKVLDLPCGTGFLTHYLHPSIEYEGHDLNHRFLKKIKKDWQKGRIKLKKITLKQNDIFNYDSYPEEKQDVIVFCDILHHIYPNHIELVENAKKFAKKIIICEPIAVRPQDNMNGRDLLAKTVIKISKCFPERLIKILDFLFADNDGINSFEKRSCWKYSHESLKELYHSLGFNKIYNILDDYIGVWDA